MPASGTLCPDRDLGHEGARSVEAVTTSAGAARVGIVDGEALLLDGVDEIDRRAEEVGGAHAVGDDLDAVPLLFDVAVEFAIIEGELVAQPRAAAGGNLDAQREAVFALAGGQIGHLAGRDLGQDDAVGLNLRLLINAHVGASFVLVGPRAPAERNPSGNAACRQSRSPVRQGEV